MLRVVEAEADEGRDVGTQVPGCGDDAHGSRAVLARRELGDHRGRNRVIRSHGYAHEEAQDEQPDRALDNRAQDRQDRDDDQVDDEHLASADQVGEPSAKGGTEEQADEGGNAQESAPVRVQDEVVAHRLHRHTDDGQDVALQEGAARGEYDDALEQRGHLEIFEVDHCVVMSHDGHLSCISVRSGVWWGVARERC